jgi:hypothetical protein
MATKKSKKKPKRKLKLDENQMAAALVKQIASRP